jgi:hypothetical protein
MVEANNEPTKDEIPSENEHLEITESEGLQDVYNQIFEAVKEISFHLRSHTSKKINYYLQQTSCFR